MEQELKVGAGVESQDTLEISPDELLNRYVAGITSAEGVDERIGNLEAVIAGSQIDIDTLSRYEGHTGEEGERFLEEALQKAESVAAWLGATAKFAKNNADEMRRHRSEEGVGVMSDEEAKLVDEYRILEIQERDAKQEREMIWQENSCLLRP